MKLYLYSLVAAACTIAALHGTAPINTNSNNNTKQQVDPKLSPAQQKDLDKCKADQERMDSMTPTKKLHWQPMIGMRLFKQRKHDKRLKLMHRLQQRLLKNCHIAILHKEPFGKRMKNSNDIKQRCNVDTNGNNNGLMALNQLFNTQHLKNLHLFYRLM